MDLIHMIDFLNSVNHVNPVYYLTARANDAALPPHTAESLWLSGPDCYSFPRLRLGRRRSLQHFVERDGKAEPYRRVLRRSLKD
jgi:hypothetical protein